MHSLYLDDKLLLTLTELELIKFLDECDSNSIKYIRLDDVSWQLLPSLMGFTLLIKPLFIDLKVDNFVQNLKTKLYRQGANVIVDRSHAVRTDLHDVVDAQITVDIADLPSSDLPVLNLFYSFKAKNKSMALIEGLIEKLNQTENDLTYNIASYWKHLTYFKYYKFLISEIPCILMEFSTPKALDRSSNDVVQSMFESLSCMYGSKTSKSELIKLEECHKAAKKKSPSSKKQPQLTNPPKKPAKKHKKMKASILSPPGNGPVNYFVRPKTSTTQPSYNPSYQNNSNQYPPMKSTFRTPIKSRKEEQVSHKTLLQNLKELDKILDNW